MRNFDFEVYFPVVQAEVYRNGSIKLIREAQLPVPINSAKRGKIKKMSRNSLARLIVVIQETEVEFKSMLTLTYPKTYPIDGRIVKDDLDYITKWITKNLNSKYLWFMEFQSRGAPHFHIMLETDAITPSARVKVATTWTTRLVTQDWFTSRYDNKEVDDEITKAYYVRDSTNVFKVAIHHKTWELIREKEGAKHYVTKYAAKQFQKVVPQRYAEVGRFWGCSRDVRPKPQITIDISDQEVRDMLAEKDHKVKDWEVLPQLIFNAK